MKLTVFSEGRMGVTASEQGSPADVHLYAVRLIGAGHRNVRVGETLEEAVSYEDWRGVNPPVTPLPELQWRHGR